MSGGSAISRAANWRSGPSANSTTSAFPGAMSPTRPKNRSGGLRWQPGRRRLIRGTPAISLSSAGATHDHDASRRSQAVLRRVAFAERRGRYRALRRAARCRGVQNYFRSLSTRSRYNRFLGAASELPPSELDRFIHVGEADRFSVIATMLIEGRETIVGEARYAFDSETASIEFGLSIDDRWQGHGIGKALLKNLECRAASFG